MQMGEMHLSSEGQTRYLLHQKQLVLFMGLASYVNKWWKNNIRICKKIRYTEIDMLFRARGGLLWIFEDHSPWCASLTLWRRGGTPSPPPPRYPICLLSSSVTSRRAVSSRGYACHALSILHDDLWYNIGLTYSLIRRNTARATVHVWR